MLNKADADVTGLVMDYEDMFGEVPSEPPTPADLEKVLREKGSWTTNGAEELVRLAEQYGSFFLRNALAVALALDIEDGTLDL